MQHEGRGCQAVIQIDIDDEDVVITAWEDDRTGVFRGLRNGRNGFVGKALGSEGMASLAFHVYTLLLEEFVQFFRTGESPIKKRCRLSSMPLWKRTVGANI